MNSIDLGKLLLQQSSLPVVVEVPDSEFDSTEWEVIGLQEKSSGVIRLIIEYRR